MGNDAIDVFLKMWLIDKRTRGIFSSEQKIGLQHFMPVGIITELQEVKLI